MKQITFLLFLLFTTCVTELKAQTTNKSFNILWGELIYDSSKLGTPWDATYKNVLVQQDVYVWKLHIKEKDSAKTHDLIGHVTIVK